MCLAPSARCPLTEGWPFWAPSDLVVVEHALDVAQLRAGEHLIDLGCGDGQVLVAAARRGASVEGVETEEDLASAAKEALAANDLRGDVHVGDVFEHSLRADVLFTYLSPATLQRLLPRLQHNTAPGTRLVTVDYHVPGIEPTLVDGRVHLYCLPATAAGTGADGEHTIGWPSAGLITTVPEDVHSLTTLSLRHPGGPVTVRPTGDLTWATSLHVGADQADAGDEVAVDIRWEPMEYGTLVYGTIECDGIGPLHVATVVSDEEHGLWEITDDGVRRMTARFDDPDADLPASVDELVEACEDDAYDD